MNKILVEIPYKGFIECSYKLLEELSKSKIYECKWTGNSEAFYKSNEKIRVQIVNESNIFNNEEEIYDYVQTCATNKLIKKEIEELKDKLDKLEKSILHESMDVSDGADIAVDDIAVGDNVISIYE